MRSLDFTACDLLCKNPCWRRLTDEENEWLKNNPIRQSFATECIIEAHKRLEKENKDESK